MTGPVDGSKSPEETGQADETGQEYWDYDPDSLDDSEKPGSKSNTSQSSYKPGKAYGSQGTSPTYPKPPVPGSGDFAQPYSSEEFEFLQSMIQKYGPDKAAQLFYNQYGYYPDEGMMYYAMYGHNSDFGTTPYSGKYLGNNAYNSPMGQAGKYYGGGDPYLQQYFQQQEMYNQAQNSASSAKKSHHQQMIRLHMILLLIMMGDFVGAMRAYAVLMDRDLRQFSRQVIKKLSLVRKARARVIRNFANKKPPRAYAGSDPNSAARAQDKAQRYTQFVQLSTQLMNELQNTERELVDILQTLKRDLDNHWQSYASMRDNEFRVNERLMTIR